MEGTISAGRINCMLAGCTHNLALLKHELYVITKPSLEACLVETLARSSHAIVMPPENTLICRGG
jgi:hypothetical protein